MVLSETEIAERIFQEVMKVQEEFGPEVASAFLAGIKFAADLREEMLTGVGEEFFSGALGEFYSNMSKDKVN
jgi:hypothetical protein